MVNFINKIKKDNISEYAASSAYFIILSIIPFTLVFISLIQYVDIDKNTLIYYANQIIPAIFQEMSLNIIEEIYSKTITTLSVSIIFTIWSASKGFYYITKGMNKIYELGEKNYFYNKTRAIISTILFTMILILTLLVLVLGNQFKNFFNSFIENNIRINFLEKIIYFRNIGLPLIIFIGFLFFYRFTIPKKVKIKYRVICSIFTTIVWYILSYGFSIYLDFNSGFSILYGSLTTIILFMIWVYCLIYVIFIGAEINTYFQK